MSDTNVETVDQNVLGNLFPDLGSAPKDKQNPVFGLQEINIDLNSKSVTDTTTVAASTTDTTTLAPVEGEANLLDDTKKKPETPLNDLTGYYTDRIKTGKFVDIKEVDDKGNEISFIPKTAEEYDEVLDMQLNHMFEKAKKDNDKNWYDSKSPAWKFIGQYAELVDDPSELIPVLQGVKMIESVSNLDENDLGGAEEIVRARMEKQGEPEEIIRSQIDALKTAGTLVPTAKQYKPLILKQEQAELSARMQEEKVAVQKYNTLITEVRDGALKAIEEPLFGKVKLKQEEKAAVYDLIAYPSQQAQGYAIYNTIDQLFDKRDFTTLREIALLLTNKEAFYNYLGVNIANQTANSLQKKLRLASESHGASGNDFHEEKIAPKVMRGQYDKTPRFGRNEK